MTFEPVRYLPSGALYSCSGCSPSVLTPHTPGTGKQGLLSQQMAQSGRVARSTMQGACGWPTVQIRRGRKMISHICLWCVGQPEGRETQSTVSNLRREGKQWLNKWEKHGATLLRLSVASPPEEHFIALWFRKTAWRFSIRSEKSSFRLPPSSYPSVTYPSLQWFKCTASTYKEESYFVHIPYFIVLNGRRRERAGQEELLLLSGDGGVL